LFILLLFNSAFGSAANDQIYVDIWLDKSLTHFNQPNSHNEYLDLKKSFPPTKQVSWDMVDELKKFNVFISYLDFDSDSQELVVVLNITKVNDAKFLGMSDFSPKLLRSLCEVVWDRIGLTSIHKNGTRFFPNSYKNRGLLNKNRWYT